MSNFRITSQCDAMVDLIRNVGPIFHGPVILPYILKYDRMSV